MIWDENVPNGWNTASFMSSVNGGDDDVSQSLSECSVDIFGLSSNSSEDIPDGSDEVIHYDEMHDDNFNPGNDDDDDDDDDNDIHSGKDEHVIDIDVTHEKVRNRANRNNILENMEDMNVNRKKTDFDLRGKCQKDNMIHSIMTAEKVDEKDHWIDINIHLERERESVIKFFMEALEHHSSLHGEHQATIESRVAMIEVHDSRATQLRQKIALLFWKRLTKRSHVM
jgi:hypothetical protein